MADYSTTAGRISILFFGDCWARRQLHSGIRYVSVGSKPMKSLSSVEGVSMLTLAEFYSMADSSTTAPRIPILIAGGCWARSQLHNGIRFVSVAWKLRKWLSTLEVVPWRNSTSWLMPPQPLGVFQFCFREVVGLSGSYTTV